MCPRGGSQYKMTSPASTSFKKDCAHLLEEKYHGVQSAQYEKDVARLKAGEPLAYVIGWVPFLGQKIFLDSKPLIPRTETEFWVEQALKETRGTRLLDLFAGSGCIGIAALAHCPDAHVDFGEIETRHFPTIEKSLRGNKIDEARTNCIETDVWSGISDRYDVIFANPPYLARQSTAVQESVREHEPSEALFAQDDGYALIEETIRGARDHLAPGGVIWIEHDPQQAAQVRALLSEEGCSGETLRDQYTLERITRGERV